PPGRRSARAGPHNSGGAGSRWRRLSAWGSWARSSLLVRVAFRGLGEAPFRRDGAVAFPGSDPPLFRVALGNHGGDILMKEIEHAVVHRTEADAQFIDPVAQVVGFRAAQLVAQVPEPFELHAALIKCPLRKRVEPLQDRDGAVIVPVKDDPS